MQKDWDELERILQYQDWYYVYAEGNAYKRGKIEYEKLTSKFKDMCLIDTERAKKLWNEYAPKGYKL